MNWGIKFLQKAGINDIEIATISSRFNQGGKYAHRGGINKETGYWDSDIVVDDRTIEGKKVFAGKTYAERGPYLDKYGPNLTGVEKEIRYGKIIGAHPKKLKAIKDMNIPDYRSDKDRPYMHGDLSEKKLQNDINTAREDVDTMAKVITRRVWKDYKL